MQLRQEIAREIEIIKFPLSEKIMGLHFKRLGKNPEEIPQRYREKYIQDSVYNLTFLASALSFDSLQAFRNYMQWLGQLMGSLEVSLEDMEEYFATTQLILQKELTTPKMQAIAPFWEEGVRSFTEAYGTRQEELEPEGRTDQVDKFLQYILNFEKEKAARMIMEKMEDGGDIREIYLQIFQPSLYRIGILWQTQVISVAKEHYATSVIQNIIGMLYPYLFAEREKSERVFMGACGGSELHEIGLRMVADFF